MKTITTVICGLLLGQLAAQDLTHKSAPQRNPIIIENATIHTISGDVIAKGSIWFDQGRIIGINSGESVDLPENTERFDASGLHVYPGLIGANTTIGLQEVGSAPGTIDVSEIGAVTPEVRAAVAVNPDATAIPVTRSNGILTVAVHPFGGRGGGNVLIPGRISAMHMDGWTWEEMTLEDDIGLLVNWPSMSSGNGRRGGRGGRGGNREEGDPNARTTRAREQINQAFLESIAYLKARKADPSMDVDLRYEAMADTISGKRSVFIRANDAEQIQSSIAWAAELDLKPVIIGGADSALCLDILKRNNVPVMVGGTHNLPRRRDAAFDSPFTLPKVLEEAGVAWCMSTRGDFSNERNLPYQAATAVAYGLPADAALRAVTLSAAEVLGISDAVGSLEKGKLATLIITDGNPLEMTTKITRAYVAGKRLDLSNKHTVLAEKYREKYRQMGLLPKK